MKSIIFWSFRIIITFIPVLFSNLAVAYNFANMGKKTFLDLLSDGQICFLTCSIAASSIVNLLEAWLGEIKPTLFSVFVFFVLLMIALLSTVFYFFFKSVFNTEEATAEPDIARWTRYRNRSVVIILVTVLIFSFIADVCLS